jgi:DnaK suppressor protein
MDHLTDQQRAQLRAVVADEQARTRARADALRRDFEEIVTASADAVRDDEHDPEGATIAFERAQVAALLADATARSRELVEAQERLDRQDLGRCGSCGGPIAFERLLARPSATRCVACAR